ncbi:MAG: envelope stress response membrane protein PspC [Pseudomonadota bacterium]
MNSPRTKLYRDKHNGKIMGVCAGVAEYTGIDAIWIRLGVVALTIGLGWPLLAYFVVGMILNKKPPYLYRDEGEEKYWQRVRQSPKRTAREIRANFRDIDRRLAAVEAHYVSSNPRLTAEIDRLR